MFAQSEPTLENKVNQLLTQHFDFKFNFEVKEQNVDVDYITHIATKQFCIITIYSDLMPWIIRNATQNLAKAKITFEMQGDFTRTLTIKRPLSLVYLQLSEYVDQLSSQTVSQIDHDVKVNIGTLLRTNFQLTNTRISPSPTNNQNTTIWWHDSPYPWCMTNFLEKLEAAGLKYDIAEQQVNIQESPSSIYSILSAYLQNQHAQETEPDSHYEASVPGPGR